MAEEKTKPPKGSRLQVQVDEETARGMYSNVVLLNHSENEFVLDFGFVAPGTQAAKIRARIVVTPRHAKRLLKALEHNLNRYEANHGIIHTSHKPGETIIN